MARYKHVDLSPRLLPVDLDAQLVPGFFALALLRLVDGLDFSAFDAYYRNDLNGAPAHSRSMLLKVVLLGYSQGVVGSRAIERACRDSVLFIAITGDAKPDPLHDKSARRRRGSLFGADDFRIADDQSYAICPAGKRLYRNGKDCTMDGYRAIKFHAPESACDDCALRAKYLRKPDTTAARQVALLTH
jgi:hypothetical protein